METEREMTERWVKETEYAIKGFRKFIYFLALIILIFLFIRYFLFKDL